MASRRLLGRGRRCDGPFAISRCRMLWWHPLVTKPMPPSCRERADPNRVIVPTFAPPEALWNILVARPVTRKEALGNPAAREAVMKDWDKLRKQRVWDEKRVRPWAEVRAEAKRTGRTIHVGRIFDICVEKTTNCLRATPDGSSKGESCLGGTTFVTRIQLHCFRT